MSVTTLSYVVAGLWLLSLITLAGEFAGSTALGVLSTLASALAGVGLMALVLVIDRNASANAGGLRIPALIAAMLGGAVYLIATLVVLFRARSFEQTSAWIMGGLALFAVWLAWYALGGAGSPGGGGIRWLGLLVAVGFMGLFAAVLAIGPIDPAQQTGQRGIWNLLQIISGGLAYVGFPIWLVLLARAS